MILEIGMKFTNKWFDITYEIFGINPEQNTIYVKVDPEYGISHYQDLNLKSTIYFLKNSYYQLLRSKETEVQTEPGMGKIDGNMLHEKIDTCAKQLESILLDISIDVQNELLKQCKIVEWDDYQTDILNENTIDVFKFNKQKYLTRLIKTVLDFHK